MPVNPFQQPGPGSNPCWSGRHKVRVTSVGLRRFADDRSQCPHKLQCQKLPPRGCICLHQRKLEREANRLWRRRLKSRAVDEACEILRWQDGETEIWSHAFEFEGEMFMLTTRLQAAKRVEVKNGHRLPGHKFYPRCLLIEVGEASNGLSPRTVTRRRQSS